MRSLITCLGECLIDFLPLQQGEATADFRMYPAGSILNVGVGIARLGQPVAFACKVADDYFGRYLRSYIVAEGIDTRFLSHSTASSTLAFVAMDNGQPSFSFYGEGAADTLLTLDDIPTALLTETGILHIGSISLLHGTTPATVLATAQQLKGEALLSLDPNIRPELVQNEPEYRALLHKLISLVDILKLSDTDLAWLSPGQSIEQGLHDLLRAGPALVVVTRGAKGALASIYRDRNTLIDIPGYAVQVVDTIGAGDTFSAALLAQLAQRGCTKRSALLKIEADELQGILRVAVAAAALNCTRAGANPPRSTELAHFRASHTDS